jgi:hypothetical protein
LDHTWIHWCSADLQIYIGSYEHGFEYSQGCTVDLDNDVWVAHSRFGSTVGHLKNNGTLVGVVNVGNGPTGVAVDGKGKVWATNMYSSTLSRIDPTAADGKGAVDLEVDLKPGCDPYNYSDMTGSTNIDPPNSGTWTVKYDHGTVLDDWGILSIAWTADTPGGSSLTVQVKSNGEDPWKPVQNGQKLSNLSGQYLYLQVTFLRGGGGVGEGRSLSGATSPVLYDLSILVPGTTAPTPMPTFMATSKASKAIAKKSTKKSTKKPTKKPTREPTKKSVGKPN